MSDLDSVRAKVQVESVTTGRPVSEFSIQTIGKSVNYILDAIMPVGSIIDSMLTEAQFQTEIGSMWVLADGRSVVGSRYEDITGETNIPDLRGIFRRGKNNGRSDGNEDPAGEETLGTFQTDVVREHTHAWWVPKTHGALVSPDHPSTFDASGNAIEIRSSHGGGFPTYNAAAGQTPALPAKANNDNASSPTLHTDNALNMSSGDNRPKNVVVNVFIRIN